MIKDKVFQDKKMFYLRVEVVAKGHDSLPVIRLTNDCGTVEIRKSLPALKKAIAYFEKNNKVKK